MTYPTRIPTATAFTAVVFDLDGTLVDSGKLVAASAIDTFRHFALPVPTAEAVIAYMGIPIEVYFPALGGPDFAALDADNVYDDYRTRFKVRVEAGELEAFEGIADLLCDLKAAGVNTGVATSKTTAPAKHSCEAAGIAQYLDVITGSDLVTNFKPAADTTLKCLEGLGLEPGPHVCVVGDAEADMGMGRAAGAKTCGVTWGAHTYARLQTQKPDHIAGSVADLRVFLGV